MKLNLIKLRSIAPTASLPGMAVLRTELRGVVNTVSVPYRTGGTIFTTAIEYLEENGFNVVGYGHYTTIPYIMSSTFKPLVQL